MNKRIYLAMAVAGGLLSSCGTATEPEAVFEAPGNWQLQSFTRGDGSLIQVPNPEKYTIQFNGDGSVHVRADCNWCNGSYESRFGTDLELGLLACTLAYCGPDSLDTSYTSALTSTSSFRRLGRELFLEYAEGTLNFLVHPE